MAEDVQGQRHARTGQGRPDDRPGQGGPAEWGHGPGVLPGRRRLAAVPAVAAAVVGIGVPVVLAGNYRSDPQPAAAAPSPPPPFVEGRLPSPFVEGRSPLPLVEGRLPSPLVDGQSPPPLVEGRTSPPLVDGQSPLPFVEGQPPSLPPLEQRADASPASPVPGVVKGLPDQGGCPVGAPRLLAALRASDLYPHLAAIRKLVDVDCYATYALARIEPVAAEPVAAEPATVFFRYTELTRSWRAVSTGTSGACGDVPQAVRVHLRRCAG